MTIRALILFLTFLSTGIASFEQEPAGLQKPEFVTGKNVVVKTVSTGRVIHRFFDTSPLSPSGMFKALFRMPYENKSPQVCRLS